MKKIFFVLAFCLSYTVLYAQDFYYSDFNPDRDMAPSVSENTFFSRGIQYGGWATPAFGIKDTGDSKTTIMAAVFRLWAKSYLWDDAFIYVRAKDSLFIPLTDGMENKNIVDLDIAYIDAKFRDGALRLSAGRKYFVVGTGLIMNGRGDGFDASYNSGYFGARLFVNYSGLFQKDENPYKISSADYSDGAKRLFAGGVLSTNILANQNFYLYGINQKDFAKDKNGRYDSLYLGAGVKGVLFANLDYYAEFIYETGKSYKNFNDKNGTEKDVAAMAVDAGFARHFAFATEPVLIFQYSYGSGGGDCYGQTAEKDTHFNSFGTFNGGLGLNPELGNLHVIRGGFSFQPLDRVQMNFIRRMTLVAMYSYYMKDKANVPINDGEAIKTDRNVGQGVDAALRWKIFSDVSLFVTYGIFLPGKAYDSTESNKQFFLCGANISF
ncbi:MAG: alginate export family protein [Leptospirales bacterium]|nr:alginate export family protein [Leptospirales bacterium]